MTFARRILAIGAVMALALPLCQCDRIEGFFKPKPAPKGPYAYTLHLQITPAAAAEMKKRDYHFNVHAFYYGHGLTAKAPGADELNRIELGFELNAYDAGVRVIGMAADTIDAKLLPQVADAQPFVMITVRSVNRSHFENELLVCNNFVGAISDAQAHPPVVQCHLSSEPGYSPE